VREFGELLAGAQVHQQAQLQFAPGERLAEAVPAAEVVEVPHRIVGQAAEQGADVLAQRMQVCGTRGEDTDSVHGAPSPWAWRRMDGVRKG
jgi:hypothetical protein